MSSCWAKRCDRGHPSPATWKYVVKREHLPPAPIYLTSWSESEGDQYVARREALIDKRMVPHEFKERQDAPVNLAELNRAHLTAQVVPASDQMCLDGLFERIGAMRLTSVNYAWAESWIPRMKREQRLLPRRIRHRGSPSGVPAFLPFAVSGAPGPAGYQIAASERKPFAQASTLRRMTPRPPEVAETINLSHAARRSGHGMTTKIFRNTDRHR